MSMASTYEVTAGMADLLRRRYGDSRSATKVLAEKAGAGLRTVENWFAGKNAPTLKHTLAMMQDDELLRELLILAGRHDIADIPGALAKIRAAQKALEGLA